MKSETGVLFTHSLIKNLLSRYLGLRGGFFLTPRLSKGGLKKTHPNLLNFIDLTLELGENHIVQSHITYNADLIG